MNHLRTLMRDKRYWDRNHPEHVFYVAGVTKAFEKAFGTGAPRRDATGKLLPASDLLASRRISAQPGTQGGAPQQRTRPDGRTVTGSDRDGKKIKLPDKSRATIPPGFPREKEDEIVEGLEKDAKKRSEIQNNPSHQPGAGLRGHWLPITWPCKPAGRFRGKHRPPGRRP